MKEKETIQVHERQEEDVEGTCHVNSHNNSTRLCYASQEEEQSKGASHKHQALFVDLGFCT